MVSYTPDVQAEIDAQLRKAEVDRITSEGGSLVFPAAPIADDALLNDTNPIGSMRMASDPGSRDRITLYSTETGMPSTILVNMLANKLGQKLPNGQPAWSRTQEVQYQVGTMLCLLHADHPRRAEFDAIGLSGKTCPKSNIPSAFEVRQHMTHTHRQEWAVIEEAREQAEREEEREFRRALIAQSAPRRGRPPKEDGDAE